MKQYTKSISSLLVLIVVIGVFYFIPVERVRGPQMYGSPEIGLAFTYPKNYFIPFETLGVGERSQRTILLAEDTLANRAFFQRPPVGTEAPPVITITAFQNDIDAYTASRFIAEAPEANGALAVGAQAPVTVGGEEGVRYRSTGLYENEHVVIARPAHVFLFTVAFNENDSSIRAVFDQVLRSVVFSEPMNPPTSADNTPPGSIHNLPVPAAVTAVRARAAEETGVEPSAILILEVAEREWSDGCLGLAGPDEMCTQAIVPGFEVTIQAKGEKRVYRTNTDGSVIRRDAKHA